MPKGYTPAPEVEAIAQDLIDQYHDYLRRVRIEYVFVTELVKSGGRYIWGKARKISGLNAWLATPEEERSDEPNPFFVMEIVLPIWNKLDDKARVALVDHELCHFSTDESDDPVLLPHDLEEFGNVVRRHGLYRPEVEFFIEAGRQSSLPGFDKVTMTVGDKELDITGWVSKDAKVTPIKSKPGAEQ